MEISVKELSKLIESGNSPTIIDVREAEELSISSLSDAIHIPINQLGEKLSQFSEEDELVIMCRSGARSHSVTLAMVNAGFINVKNLIGGINEWAKSIDDSVTVY